MKIPSQDDIIKAASLIKPYIHNTPVLTSSAINKITGGNIFFKCENFQKVGAFKIRGAVNAVFSLSKEEIKKGVATHSSGNHAAALALAARYRGVKAYIAMPETAPEIKKRAVEGYGAIITFCKPTLKAREDTLKEIVNKTGATSIHPYNNYQIISGQGTAGMELLNEVGKLDKVIVPVGGGGLASGTGIIVKSMFPETEVIAAEPAMADDAYRSFYEGKIFPSVNPKTIADGLLTSLGDKTFHIIRHYFDSIVRVDEDSIIEAMRLIWERMKIIVEPSSAVPLAAILSSAIDVKDKKTGIILSGGNVDLDQLPWLKNNKRLS